MTWSGKVIFRVGPTGAHNKRGRDIAKKIPYFKRRFVCESFPAPAAPMTSEQIESYFSGDTIICLMCGKNYRNVGIHLSAVHQMTPREYKDRYGLPYSRGLISDESKAVKSSVGKRIARQKGDGLFPKEVRQRAIERSQDFFRHNSLPRQPYAIQKLRDRGFDDSPLEKLLERVRCGRFPCDVFNDPDMPGQTWIFSRLNRRPDIRKKLAEITDAMPFSWQAEARINIGPRIVPEIKRLRAEGKSDNTIANKLGVSAMAIWYKRKKHDIR